MHKDRCTNLANAHDVPPAPVIDRVWPTIKHTSSLQVFSTPKSSYSPPSRMHTGNKEEDDTPKGPGKDWPSTQMMVMA